jgi:hypothetical protein
MTSFVGVAKVPERALPNSDCIWAPALMISCHCGRERERERERIVTLSAV